MHARRRVATIIALALVAVTAACEFDEITIAPGDAHPVVHGVLNPATTDQLILVERILTGAIPIADRRYSRTDPIVTGSGDPISDALVIVYGPNGDSAIAVEDSRTRSDGRGAGVYRFRNGTQVGRIEIAPGRRYRLRVVTPTGTVVTGETLVPSVPFIARDVIGRVMNRDRDTLQLFWDSVPGTARYLVRADGPGAEISLYTAEFEAHLPGGLRNVFQETFPLIFIPGFRHRVDVDAIDENYFDYYRSGNDPFTGSGLINHLEGGTGLFGSVAGLYAYSVVVTADFHLPIEGNYGLQGSLAGRFAPASMTLYVLSDDGIASNLSGSYTLGLDGAGIVGRLEGNQISLAFLDSETEFTDTLVTFTGQVVGDSLIGTARRGNTNQTTRFGKK